MWLQHGRRPSPKYRVLLEAATTFRPFHTSSNVRPSGRVCTRRAAGAARPYRLRRPTAQRGSTPSRSLSVSPRQNQPPRTNGRSILPAVPNGGCTVQPQRRELTTAPRFRPSTRGGKELSPPPPRGSHAGCCCRRGAFTLHPHRLSQHPSSVHHPPQSNPQLPRGPGRL